MEKSFLSFAATYPSWEPAATAKQMLACLGQEPGSGVGPHVPWTAMLGSRALSPGEAVRTGSLGSVSPFAELCLPSEVCCCLPGWPLCWSNLQQPLSPARPHLTSLLQSVCCPCGIAGRLIEAFSPAGGQAQHSMAVPAVMAPGGARVPGLSRLNPAHVQGRLQPMGACQDSFLGSVEMPERATASNQLLLAGSHVLGSSSYVAGNRVAMQQLSLQVNSLTSLLALPVSNSCGLSTCPDVMEPLLWCSELR